MLLRKNFENLHTVMAILALFEQLSRRLCLKFVPLIMSASPNMNYTNVVIIKTFLKIASGVMHTPHLLSGFVPELVVKFHQFRKMI